MRAEDVEGRKKSRKGRKEEEGKGCPTQDLIHVKPEGTTTDSTLPMSSRQGLVL